MVCSAIHNLALIGRGVLSYPAVLTASSDGPKGLAADLFILTAYGVVEFYGAGMTNRYHPRRPSHRGPTLGWPLLPSI